MRGWRCGVMATVLAALVLAVFVLIGPLRAEENDLREFRLGMRVDELPHSGYLGFTCADAPSTALAGWQDFARCPAGASGWREVRFRYDEAANPKALINDDYEGTKIGGHPVLISLQFDDAGRVEGIRIQTDPKARLYLKKKAFLFGRQAMERYGEEGWLCSKQQPGAGEEPVGGLFMKDHCEKTTETRRYVLDRELLRHPGEPLKDFVSNTQLTILRNE